MRLAVLGATGFIGQSFVRKALAAGHEIRALARQPDSLGDLASQVVIVRGDMFTPATLATLIQGVDGVVSAAGPPREGRHASEPYEAAMKTVVASMKSVGATRLITIAGAAARMPGEALGLKRSALRALLGTLVMPDVIRTKDIEVAVVVDSGLDWTVVRPPRVGRGQPTGEVKATDRDLAGTGIDVDDLTDFMVRLLDTDEWIGRAPTVASIRRRSA